MSEPTMLIKEVTEEDGNIPVTPVVIVDPDTSGIPAMPVKLVGGGGGMNKLYLHNCRFYNTQNTLNLNFNYYSYNNEIINLSTFLNTLLPRLKHIPTYGHSTGAANEYFPANLISNNSTMVRISYITINGPATKDFTKTATALRFDDVVNEVI